MAQFTERHEYKLEVIPPFSIIQCRRSDIIEKDGVEVARTYHRHSRCPGEDVSEDCPELQAVAAALWTPELIAEYQAQLALQQQQSIAAQEVETASGDKEFGFVPD